jgi:hypothetical protein
MKKLQIRRADVWLYACCAFAALTTVAVIAAQESTRSARAMAARVIGSVEYQTAAKQPWQPVKVGMVFSEGLRCRTGAGSSLDLALTTGAIVRLNEESEFRLDKLAFKEQGLPAAGKPRTGLTQLTMERGQLISQVGKQSSSTFEIKTQIGIVEVRGAGSMIWRVENRIFVRCFHDTVLLRNANLEYTIRAGEQMGAEFDPQTGVLSRVQAVTPAPTGDLHGVQYAAFTAGTAALASALIDKGVVDLDQLLQIVRAWTEPMGGGSEGIKVSGQPLPKTGVIVVGNPATTIEVSPSRP